jgi:hypothetical protein
MVKRTLIAAAIVVAAAATLAGGTSAGRPAGSSCTLDVSAPFIYDVADIVLAPATISCSSSQNRITVSTVLTRDGSEVASNTRHCRHTAVCHNDVGSHATDIAGNQVWCTTGSGSVHGQTFAPVTRCESEEF